MPKTLREAVTLLAASKVMRAAFGDEVINHFVQADNREQFEYDRHVTDWERTRMFGRG